MRLTRSRFAPLALFAFVPLVALAACGHAHDATTDSSAARDSTPPATAPSASAAVTPASSAADGASAPIIVADIDAWQKGMDGELKAVQDAGTQRKNAKNTTDSLNAMFAAQESSTEAAGAKAAGMTDARYRYVSSTLSPIVGNLSPLDSSITTKDMPAAVVTEMRQSREQSATQEMAKMSPDVQAALRARAPALRKQSLELAAARLKAAGAIH